ncbi:EVE domain-containing protein [Rubellimicrobium sp. CFH 75288]|uniref:EVE domain-containing protein n=1 Tax=Rubellimicrobium sp. CFH 75288 TaxID=2697034 RepID=UPI001412C722|nr:EVE domain-containing protein [Rubellimicrobium sp. CFH 75288]NAZ37799.1 EVE domain-containing protein [Rubellimicrobium sp. CFH 75288]
MAFWLFKSEPHVFSWADQVALGDAGGPWDGVRNHAARNHMRAMTVGDRGFFYHSGAQPAVVGLVEVVAPAAPDPTAPPDSGWDCVSLRALAPLPRPVSLRSIKAEPALAEMVLVRNSRLSVQPVRPEEWERVCAMGGLAP